MDYYDNMDSLAEVFIERITFRGALKGGAYECKTCPKGTVSRGQTFECTSCPAGTEPTKDKTACTPCKEGWYNSEDRGKCKRCPSFTNSRRHSSDYPVYDEKSEETVLD